MGMLHMYKIGIDTSGGWSDSSHIFRTGGTLPGTMVYGSDFLPVRLLLINARSKLSVLSE